MNTPPIDENFQVGDVLANKYRVERVLGRGNMGVVLAAHHLELDERVAIKVLRQSVRENPEAVARFEREARAAVKIKSEHVARVIDVGRLENDAPFIVMEYLEGQDLGAIVDESGPLSFEQAADFVLQACEALAEAHVLGIVHRDLKPSNLFRFRRTDETASIKVLDFGISKATRIDQQDITQNADVLGTPAYMSPEQLQSSREIDARADIWSLGVVLYELVSGQLPFESDQVMVLMSMIMTQPYRPLKSLRGDVPPALEVVIGRCLEKDREVRFANVGELATALSAVASSRAATSVERTNRVLRAAARTSTAEMPEVKGGSTQRMAWTPPRMASTQPMVSTQRMVPAEPIPPTELAPAEQPMPPAMPPTEPQPALPMQRVLPTSPLIATLQSAESPMPAARQHVGVLEATLQSRTPDSSMSEASTPTWLKPAPWFRRGVVALALVGVIAGVAVWRARSSPVPLAPAVPVASAPVAVATVVPVETPPASGGDVEANPSPASAPTASASAPPNDPPRAPAVKASVPIHRAASPASKPAASVDARTKVNCDPPFYFDAQGNKMFRRECL